MPDVMTTAPDSRFHAWVRALEERHLATLRAPEVARALRALSSAYVERRHRLARGAALDGSGKRAAFALFYGPLHFLIVRAILDRLGGAAADTIVDLGCGTGAAGAAWADTLGRRPRVVGIDKHQWAVAEASRTYRQFGLRATTRQGDAARVPIPTRRTGIVAGWLANELTDDGRAVLRRRLLDASRRGAAILVVEPVARGVAPWWDAWEGALVGAGGRSDEWRFRVTLPEIVRRLGRAAGLSPDELTARSLWLAARVEA
jgi:SAM-dependent methyltransferase